MKKKISIVLTVALLILCFVLGDITTVRASDYGDAGTEGVNALTNNDIILSGITPKIKSLKSPKKKQITVKYNKIPNVEYYHIVISTDRLGKGNRKDFKTTKTTFTIKKLKSKKTYYVKVRGCIGTSYNDMGEEFADDATFFSGTKKIKVK